MILSYFKIEILAIHDEFVTLGHKGLTECRITIEIYTQVFFIDPEVIFSSHAMFINASIKEHIYIYIYIYIYIVVLVVILLTTFFE